LSKVLPRANEANRQRPDSLRCHRRGDQGRTVTSAKPFQDPGELERVDDFLTTIAEIGRLTGLYFGEAIEQADIRRGEDDSRPERLDDIPLKPVSADGRPPRPQRRGTRNLNVRGRS
jgi:hypothetical protein